MTREEAIKELKIFSGTTRIRLSANFWEALNTVIEALEQQSSEDCVSRAEVRKIAKEMFLEVANMELDIKTISDCISYTSSKCRQVLEDKLNNMPPVTPTQNWIPCSEGLPKIHNRCEKYLVTLEHGGTYVALFTECDGKHWWAYDDVVAWMPLPKPYVPDTNVGKMEEMESEDGN